MTEHPSSGSSLWLVVSLFFPPMLGARSIQMAKFIKYLRRLNISVAVVALDPKYNLSREKDSSLLTKFIDSSVIIKRIKCIFFNRYLFKMLLLICGLPYLGSVLHAARECQRLVAKKKYDVVYTVSTPFSSHLVGFILKSRNIKTKWVAYFSDPFSRNPLQVFRCKLRNYVMKKMIEEPVIKKADMCVFPSEKLKRFFLRGYSDRHSTKAVVMPHFYDPEIMPRKTRVDMKLRTRFVSVGSYYRRRRLDILFESLMIIKRRSPRLLQRLEVDIYGESGAFSLHSCYEKVLKELSGIVTVHCRVNYENSIKEMVMADYLLFFDVLFSDSPFFPSKLADYIGAGVPIIGIAHRDSCSAGILCHLGYPVVEPQRSDTLAHLIGSLVKGESSIRPTDAVLRQGYSCDTVIETFVQKVKGFCKLHHQQRLV